MPWKSFFTKRIFWSFLHQITLMAVFDKKIVFYIKMTLRWFQITFKFIVKNDDLCWKMKGNIMLYSQSMMAIFWGNFDFFRQNPDVVMTIFIKDERKNDDVTLLNGGYYHATYILHFWRILGSRGLQKDSCWHPYNFGHCFCFIMLLAW